MFFLLIGVWLLYYNTCVFCGFYHHYYQYHHRDSIIICKPPRIPEPIISSLLNSFELLRISGLIRLSLSPSKYTGGTPHIRNQETREGGSISAERPTNSCKVLRTPDLIRSPLSNSCEFLDQSHYLHLSRRVLENSRYNQLSIKSLVRAWTSPGASCERTSVL